MNERSSHLWACAAVAGLVLASLVCVTGIGVVAWLQLGPGSSRAARVDRIAFVGVDGNIYTIDRDGRNRLALTEDAQLPTREGGRLYRFPTWSPDGQWVAFVGVELSQGRSPTSTLYAAHVADSELRSLFASQVSAPFYLYWSPDSTRVAFLSGEDGELSLRLASLEGESRLLDTGAPFCFTWSPTSETLITHVGGSLPLGRIGRLEIGAQQPETLLEEPAMFLAPAWAPKDDVVLFAAELDDRGPALYLADDRGEPQRELVRYDGAISFVWSPRGERVAYIVSNQPRPSRLGQFAFGRIHVIDRTGGEPRLVSPLNAVALFWAPDGQAIAYLTIRAAESLPQGLLHPAGTTLQSDQLKLEWHAANLRTGDDLSLVSFVPSSGFLSLIPFFDQYAQSLTLWSPDSDALVYGARGDDGSPGIWVVPTDRRTPPQRIADGDSPVWSWK